MTEGQVQRRLLGWWLLVGSLAVLSFGSRAAGDDEPAGSDTFYRYDTAAFGSLFYVLLLSFALLLTVGFDRREAFALRPPASWGRAIRFALGVFVTMWILAVALEQLFHAGDEQGLDPDRITAGRVPPFLVNLALAAVMVPVVEELIYRGIGFTLLARQFGDVVAIVFTSIAFALAHGIVEGLPVFFVIGAALALVRSRTGSIYPAIAMHGLFNGSQLLVGALI